MEASADRPIMTSAERTAESLHLALIAINEADQDVNRLATEDAFELACATLRARTENKLVVAAYTAIMVLAPPSLVSFLIPWPPAGMLLQKANLRTVGYAVVIGYRL